MNEFLAILLFAAMSAAASFVLGFVFMSRVFPIPLHQRPRASAAFAGVVFVLALGTFYLLSSSS